MESKTDTNFGWWTDKPDRLDRHQPQPTSLTPIVDSRRGGVWFKSLLIVGLITCFAWSLTLLAGV